MLVAALFQNNPLLQHQEQLGFPQRFTFWRWMVHINKMSGEAQQICLETLPFEQAPCHKPLQFLIFAAHFKDFAALNQTVGYLNVSVFSRIRSMIHIRGGFQKRCQLQRLGSVFIQNVPIFHFILITLFFLSYVCQAQFIFRGFLIFRSHSINFRSFIYPWIQTQAYHLSCLLFFPALGFQLLEIHSPSPQLPLPLLEKLVLVRHNHLVYLFKDTIVPSTISSTSRKQLSFTRTSYIVISGSFSFAFSHQFKSYFLRCFKHSIAILLFTSSSSSDIMSTSESSPSPEKTSKIMCSRSAAASCSEKRQERVGKGWDGLG